MSLINFSSTIFEGDITSNSPALAASEVIINETPIRDFHSQPGLAAVESTGTINLAWTAPGDDGDIGRADHYVIKFFTDPLSDSNWNSAFDAPNPPVPLDAGSQQSYELTGLEDGRRYYLAIKTYDDAGNVSQISNVTSTFASGIMTPTLVGEVIDTASNAAELYANPVESGMPIYYEFELDTVTSFTNPVVDIDLFVDTLVSVTFTQLQDDVIYYWRCRAVASDGSDSSAWSAIGSFLMYSDDDIAPVVQVSSPNGGENWPLGSTQTIRWNANDNVGVVSCRIEYSPNNGGIWYIVADWNPVSDTVLWTVPTPQTSLCLVRVSARDDFGNIGIDVSNGVFSTLDSVPPSVLIGEPIIGDSVTMGWTASDNGMISHYLIDYTTDSGQNWVEIASGEGGDSGSVTMPVPESIPQVSVRVTCFDLAENAGSDTITFEPISVYDGPTPTEFFLGQSYPNPFNPTMTIEFGLLEDSQVMIELFDITGARVAVLVDQEVSRGVHQAVWNAGEMASGTYFYRISAGDFNDVKRAVLLK
jgi:hypothetical protein